jgi:PAS domain S-box-containing protein
MPHFSGLEALKLFKESGMDLPFIIVSGSIGEDVAVEAMKSGAQDYLMKNNLARFVPAIQQELREAEVRRKLKVSQKALEDSEKRYRQVVENATEIIYTIDEKGNFTYGNPAGLKLTGYSLQELRSFNYADLVAPEHRERVSQAYINQFRERRPTIYIEFPFFSKSGEIIWFGQNTSLVIEDGKVVGFHIIARDITERKQAEERLQERERYFRRLMYTLHEDIVVIDCDYRITDVNNTFLITTGSTREKVIGKHCYEISHGYAEPCDRHGEQCLIGEVFETGKSCNCKHVHMRGDGLKVHVDILLSPLKDDSGSVTHVVEAVRDVTDIIQAYGALRSSEEKYRTILENIEEGYYEVDIAGNFTFLNDSMCRIFGYPKEELMGMNDRQYTDGENTKRLFQAFNKVYRTGEPHIGYDYEIIRKDGAKRYVEASILLQKDSSGKPLGFRGIIRDVTERKRAEQALFDSEQRYGNLVENAPDVIFTLATDGTITSFNPVFETITGWSRSEWLGKAFTAILRPDDLPRGLEFFQSVLKGEKTVPFELRVLRESGDYLTAEFTVTPQTRDGSVIGVLGIARDITDRKLAEEALRSNENKYRTLIENVPQKIFLKDKNSVYISCNENYAQDLKIKPDEISGRTDYDFYPKELAEKYRADDKKIIERGKTEEIEEKYIQNGQEVWVDTIKTPVKDEKGNHIGILGIFWDITDRKRREEEMVVLQEQLRQSQKIEAIGRLAGGIAHDFNNLLTVINGYSQLSLIELKEDVPLRGNIEEIKRASEKAADLTRQLLAFSRRQILEMRVLDLNTVLRELDKMLHRLIGEDIELITVFTDDLGRVNTDPGWVEQIILNLSVNARDAMHSGGKLTIETANVELDETYARGHIAVKPGRYVMLSVSDTGVGMTREVRQQVFEPFFTTKEKGKGTGLGLSTVYGIVKQSGGNIWVYSEPGKGTTFKIYLPRVDEPLEEIKERVVKEGLPHGSETILVVEDEKEVRKLAVQILQRQGYTVLDAPDGDGALVICGERKDPIHLILTDVVMPGMSGRQLADRLGSFHPEMKVLYMSGYTDNAITHHGVLEKGMDYIQKPFTVDGLARKVREVLDK